MALLRVEGWTTSRNWMLCHGWFDDSTFPPRRSSMVASSISAFPARARACRCSCGSCRRRKPGFSRAARCSTSTARHSRRRCRSRIALTANRGAMHWAKPASTSGGSISTASVIPTAIRKWTSLRPTIPRCASRRMPPRQLEAAVRFILAHQNIEKLSLISHSWGSMPAGLFAGSAFGAGRPLGAVRADRTPRTAALRGACCRFRRGGS